ncbi:serine threonine protein kinase [Musa troglodytarum]|uniref:Serine threonine protein kinase n=1 Tax=Musa troglodytarum TaxID=320322 RepID=A0A9E7HPE6_9LILI|nr:serine threonine protein kinase [Musa troglodytarum]URE37141.1 serine threonine protein kinase [Musa troglodytarum]
MSGAGAKPRVRLLSRHPTSTASDASVVNGYLRGAHLVGHILAWRGEAELRWRRERRASRGSLPPPSPPPTFLSLILAFLFSLLPFPSPNSNALPNPNRGGRWLERVKGPLGFQRPGTFTT